MLYLQKMCILPEAFNLGGFRPCGRLPGSSGKHSHPQNYCLPLETWPWPPNVPPCPLLPQLMPPGGGDRPLAPLLPGAKMEWALLALSLSTGGHLILAGFVLFILVNRAVYFQFVFLGVLLILLPYYLLFASTWVWVNMSIKSQRLAYSVSGILMAFKQCLLR